MKFLLYFCLAFAFMNCLSGCTRPSEKTGDQPAEVIPDSNSIVLTSRDKVFWAQEPDEGNSHPDYGNPIGIPFNNSRDVVDTAAFRSFFGASAKILFLDSTAIEARRFIITYKQSEICIVQEWNGYDLPPTTKLYSALIRDKEIALKNGVMIGMFKKQVLDKYPFVTEPSDVIYVKDDDGSLIRFEFKNNRLAYIEFWANVSIRNTFGGFEIYGYPELYDPMPESINKEYFTKLLGSETTLETDTILYEAESEQGEKLKSAYYRYLVTHQDSQFELIDHTGEGTNLVVTSAILLTPRIILNDSIYVGMSQRKLVEHFDLQEFTAGYKIFWLVTRGKKFRFTFSDSVVTSIEFANGRL